MRAHPGLAEIERARAAIAGRVRRTPARLSPRLAERLGVPVVLKHEHEQITGAFKLRGATNALANLSEDERARGVVTVSTGNHGRALAHAAREAGVRCVVAMSRLVPGNKRDAIAALGAEIAIHGASQDEAQEEVDRRVAEGGLVEIPPFDHPDVIAGQGTLGLEIVEDVPDLAQVLIPLSGGGLAAGVAAAVKAKRPHARIVGITMERGAAMHASLAAGRPVLVEEAPSLADSLGGGIGLANRHTFPMLRDLMDEVVLLTEDEITLGMAFCHVAEGVMVEGGGAVGPGAILAGKVRPIGPTVALLTGANVDPAQHARIVSDPEILERLA
ncbi:hydroxyectoine utilization dehydratase EutB [Salinarimonas ramus]|uniref:Hydroxyectoine utilization dehydratase EutB n=1 Tax=Salinarimonas ramus TaxID=690164 RepID=A0A917Q4N0_9HYPH|nr:hydroxyectoine utilization dehydratase EutB [Salinarimonas ramus]GGK21975.1 hydroxyectoine utilization dehydratase EutB [Salinarimonas ramus]